jgi:hypothetical protein
MKASLMIKFLFSLKFPSVVFPDPVGPNSKMASFFMDQSIVLFVGWLEKSF